MRSRQPVPYFLKLPPYDLTSILNGLTTFIAWVLLLGLGMALGLLLLWVSNAKGLLAGVFWFVGMATPWALLVIDELYFLPRRPHPRFNIWAKWCYVPTVNSESEAPKKAWIWSRGGPRITIDEPGFYLLKSGYHVMFVGTSEEWASFLDMAMNGGL